MKKSYKKEIMYQIKMQSINVFLNKIKVVDFQWKMLMTAKIKGCVTWLSCFFGSYLGKVSFIIVGCVKDFREEGRFCPPPPHPE